jgi:hypothetical protein
VRVLDTIGDRKSKAASALSHLRSRDLSPGLSGEEVHEVLQRLSHVGRVREFLQLLVGDEDEIRELRAFLRAKGVPWSLVFAYWEPDLHDSLEFLTGFAFGAAEAAVEGWLFLAYFLSSGPIHLIASKAKEWGLVDERFADEIVREREQFWQALGAFFLQDPLVSLGRAAEQLRASLERAMWELDFLKLGRVFGQATVIALTLPSAARSIWRLGRAGLQALSGIARLSFPQAVRLAGRAALARLVDSLPRPPRLVTDTGHVLDLVGDAAEPARQAVVVVAGDGRVVGQIALSEIVDGLKVADAAGKGGALAGKGTPSQGPPPEGPPPPAGTVAQRVAAWLTTLSDRFPILQELKLDEEAIARILRKRDFNQLKGQLFEELTASRVRRLLETEAGRRALGVRPGETVEFIPGHRVRAVDRLGPRQFSDGLVVARNAKGEITRTVAIVESKAGGFSSDKLAASHESLTRLSRRAAREHRLQAIREFETRHAADPGSAGLTAEEIDSTFKSEVDKIADELRATEEGQVSRDAERLTELPVEIRDPQTGVWQELPRSTRPKRTKIVGFVPSDIDALEITKAVKRRAPYVNFETQQLDADSEAVRLLTEEVAARAKLEGG